ncbi:MAG: hypothetical protein ABIQ40_01700 [Bacteroidia bacterium]
MANIKLFSIFILTIIFSSLFMMNSCSKDKNNCYDPKLYRQHKDDICLADCPGVTGCDGNFYCNECEARRNGISIR